LAGTYRQHEADEGLRFVLRGDVLCLNQGGRDLPTRPFADDGVIVGGAAEADGPGFPVRFLLDGRGEAWALSDGARIARRVGSRSPGNARIKG
jgi:hypothetical protein